MRSPNGTCLFLTLILLTPLSVKGQPSFAPDAKNHTLIDQSLVECLYEYSVKALEVEDSIQHSITLTYQTILQANANVSKFWDWHAFKLDSLLFTTPIPLTPDSQQLLTKRYTIGVKYFFIPLVFKNYPMKTITVIDDLGPDVFLYEYPKTGHDWQLTDDTLTVCGYVCNRATTRYEGRVWEAWYAPEIPLSDGPWKLYGLPGLILKALDKTGEHCFEAISLRNASHPIYLTHDAQCQKTKRTTFIKQKIPFFKNFSSYIRMNPAINSLAVINGSALIINGHRSSVPGDADINPLELTE